MKVFLRRVYDIIEERIGDILAANIRASQERLSRPQRQQASIWPEGLNLARKDFTYWERPNFGDLNPQKREGPRPLWLTGTLPGGFGFT
jgi:hypothetical protein